MVNVPRDNEFSADILLMWQGRARRAEAKLESVRLLQSQLAKLPYKIKESMPYYGEQVERISNELDAAIRDK